MTLLKHTINTEAPGYSAVETITSIQPDAALHFTPAGVNLGGAQSVANPILIPAAAGAKSRAL